MNQTDLRELYDYDRWASNRVLDAVDTLDESQRTAFTEARSHGIGSVRELLTHHADAQTFWLARLGGEITQMPDNTRFDSVEAVRDHCNAANAGMVGYLEGLEPGRFDDIFEFSFRPGSEPIRIRTDRMLQHIAVHGINHRAEASELLTAAGSPPGSLDLLAYYRANSLA